MNEWILFTIGMLIGTVADYVEIYQDLNDRDRENIEKNLLSFMVNQMEGGHGEDSLTTGDKVANMSMALYKSMFKNIASKTYLRGLIDFLSALDGNDVDRRGMWWINNKGSLIALIIDHQLRKESNFYRTMKL